MPKNKLLFISSIGCGPPYHGNRARLKSLIVECKRLGFVIHFAGVNLPLEEKKNTLNHVDEWVWDFEDDIKPINRSVSWLKKIKQELINFFKPHLHLKKKEENLDRWFNSRWLVEARSLAQRQGYNLVIVEYVFHSAFLEAFPNTTRRILDTHDVFSDRNERLISAGLPAEANWFSVSESGEQIGLSRANKILAIQPNEAKHFKRLTSGNKSVHVVGHFVDVSPLPAPLNGDLLVGYIGSENPLNTYALREFLTSIWPLVMMKVPSARLVLAGGVCETIAPPPDSVVLGSIKDQIDFYKLCVLTVNPMQVGTGLKIKTVESMAYGRAVVSTPCGAEGLETYEGRGLFIAQTAEVFANTITELLLDMKNTFASGLDGADAVNEMNHNSREELKFALFGERNIPRTQDCPTQ